MALDNIAWLEQVIKEMAEWNGVGNVPIDAVNGWRAELSLIKIAYEQERHRRKLGNAS